jgi:hypothetical protein
MAEVDWSDLTGTALGSSDVARGVSSAFTKVTGGGTYVYGFRSASSTAGFAGKYCNLANFAPITGSRKGASIRALVKRYASGGNYAPMFGIMKGTDPATAEGYFIGLSAASSYQIVLKKGTPASGLQIADSGVLRYSTQAYTDVGDAAAVWFHLRLDVLVNPHGEVALQAWKNTVTPIDLSNVIWGAPSGMAQFIDDPMGVLSGSAPHLDGFYVFYGIYTEAAGSVALFDHFEVFRQTAP